MTVVGEQTAATLTLPPSVEHVRTARLVAVTAARRLGLDEQTVDDVRLAVGEAVARAVRRHASAGVDDDVDVVLRDDSGAFVVEIDDRAPADTPDDDEVGLALVTAVVPDAEVQGGRVVLRWPATA
ncbi:MAG: ATP-binding protein [Actinobacteria bacterium]|nr:ATP-binding protein [Actinomycetota bacterium]